MTFTIPGRRFCSNLFTLTDCIQYNCRAIPRTSNDGARDAGPCIFPIQEKFGNLDDMNFSRISIARRCCCMVRPYYYTATACLSACGMPSSFPIPTFPLTAFYHYLNRASRCYCHNSNLTSWPTPTRNQTLSSRKFYNPPPSHLNHTVNLWLYRQSCLAAELHERRPCRQIRYRGTPLSLHLCDSQNTGQPRISFLGAAGPFGRVRTSFVHTAEGRALGRKNLVEHEGKKT